MLQMEQAIALLAFIIRPLELIARLKILVKVHFLEMFSYL